ncbi:hypothetical protein AIGOOFII_2320 [Methylobacterium marchantiae]|nr:hypothetical protein AIGOOFII_2320 [Methylobacterium marchantiae]
MKTLALTLCTLAVSSFALAQMTTDADARSRHSKRGMSKAGMSANTSGGRYGRGSSAASGNSSQPARGAGTGSAGGGSGGNGGL